MPLATLIVGGGGRWLLGLTNSPKKVRNNARLVLNIIISVCAGSGFVVPRWHMEPFDYCVTRHLPEKQSNEMT